MFRPFAIAAMLMLVAGTVHAQDAKHAEKPAEKTPAAASGKLSVGDKAPAIEVEKFLKGTPVTGYEKGKTYVVEFWATWCGPCVASMPHISELQKEYKDRVTIVGINIWEDKVYSAETLTKAQTFVDGKGDTMGYTVAFDGAAKKMDTAFMKAAGRNGIPSCFVVDGEGKIAWIGHPMWLDTVLPDVTSGKYEADALAGKVKEGEKAQRAVFEKMSTDPKAAVVAWEKFEKEYKGPAKVMEGMKYTLFAEAGEFEKLYAFMGKKAEEAIAQKDTMALNEIAWQMVDPESTLKNPDLALALKAATKANEFSGEKDPAILDTLARVYWVKGDKKKAAEIQAKAVEFAGKDKKFEAMKAELEERLAEYKK